MLRIFDPLSRRESVWLEGSCLDRPSVVIKWIYESMERAQPLLAVDPPIVAGAFDEFSRGVEGMMQAIKLADVPCYYLHSQLQKIQQLSYLFVPMVVYLMVEDDTRPDECQSLQNTEDQSRWKLQIPFFPPFPLLYVMIMTLLFTAKIFMAFMLENPFGSELQEQNKVPVLDLHERFLEKMIEVRSKFASIQIHANIHFY